MSTLPDNAMFIIMPVIDGGMIICFYFTPFILFLFYHFLLGYFQITNVDEKEEIRKFTWLESIE